MTIDKAIEILTYEVNSSWNAPDPDLRDALRLGTEALEEVKYYRNNPVSYVLKLLPGETEE